MAASKKSQKEAEQFVKQYQLDAVENQYRALGDEMRNSFKLINESLKTLITKSEAQVSPQQFAENLGAMRTTTDKQISEEIEKIHLEYRPLKDNLKWLLRAVVAQAIVIVGQIMLYFYVSGNN